MEKLHTNQTKNTKVVILGVNFILFKTNPYSKAK
jgi:hypothetical protein